MYYELKQENGTNDANFRRLNCIAANSGECFSAYAKIGCQVSYRDALYIFRMIL